LTQETRFERVKASSPDGVRLFRVSRRADLHAEVRDLVFDAEAGAVLTPVRHERGVVIMQVLWKARATLDESTRKAMEGVLFEDATALNVRDVRPVERPQRVVGLGRLGS
jgi:hypothetical protein